MIESKAWNWKKLNYETQKKIWLEPAIETYYLVERWKKQNKKEFLDIGCGLGRHSILFAKEGFNTSAIDLSDEALKSTKEWAEKENLNINLKKCDMVNLPYKENSFDCILCRNVIAHTDTEGVITIINKIYDLLKEDGECFLTLGSKNASTYKDPKNPAVDENTKIRMDEGPEKGVPHFYADMEIIPKLFEKFKIEHITQEQEFKKMENGEYKSFWHYYLLIKK